MKQLYKITFVLFCCGFNAAIAAAQNDSLFSLVKTIKGNFSGFTVDNLDNIYLLSPGDQLKKINSNGDSLAVFNDVKRFGSLTQIDVTNPLKILLYYRNFSTIVVLDRFLNSRNTINLRRQQIFAVNCITASYDNNIWLYDEQDYKIKKVDDDGRVLMESNDFRMLFDSVPSASQITDRNNFIYLYDSTKGFYSFDYFGSFKNRVPFLRWNNTAVSEQAVYGFSNNKLYSYQPLSLNVKEYPLPSFFGNYQAIKAVNNKVYLLKSDAIYIYTVK